MHSLRVRRLVLYGLMALAAMALTAPSAFGAIEVKTEPNPTSVHCGTAKAAAHVASDGCSLHVGNTQRIYVLIHNPLHTAETTLAVCDNEFEARVGESGEGYIYSQSLTGVPELPGCVIKPCQEKIGGDPMKGHGEVELWPFHIKDVGATEVLEVALCVQPFAGASGEIEGMPCTLHAPISKLAHTYIINANPELGCEEDEREIKGQWTLENAGEGAHTNIEIVNT